MSHRRILLVDDDADDQFIFKDAISEIESGIECIIANNGLEALVNLKTSHPAPSLIFLDLNMPLMNGFECLERIKQDNQYKQIPVIILTTSDSPVDQKHTQQLGAETFFTKTSDFKLLKSKLRNILNTDFSKL
ncbi:MAG: response regulator [Parafilimonas sp.]